MNRRMIFFATGRILQVEAFFLVLSGAVSLLYKEWRVLFSFLICAGIALALGTASRFFSKPKTHIIYAKEGFVIVSAAWIFMSLIGALPFVFTREIPSFVDALFEMVSGFTTTGASIVPDVTVLSRGTLFWRSFSHWIGGMGIIVFVAAVLPGVSERPIHILRAEMPGPTMGKLSPRIKDTAVILYLIYIVLTALLIVLLCFGGMPFFESVLHALGTAGTGGFGIKIDSIASYSPYIQWVITIFMMVFAVNFNIYFLLLIKRFKTVLKSEELLTFIGIIVVSTAAITVNIMPMYESVEDSIRYAAFQVGTIISTTGYTTTDFNLWPQFSKTILFILMLIGGCAGSTAGGIKISRIVIMFKRIGKEIKHMIHPRSVSALKFEGQTVDAATSKGIASYFLIYFVLFFVILLLICLDPFNFGGQHNVFETHISAVAACFNNVGPGLAGVGPTASYAAYSNFSKIVLTAAMLLGRLEIFPLIIALSPTSWSKSR